MIMARLAEKERHKKKNQGQPAREMCTCLTPSSSNMTTRGTAKSHDDAQGGEEVQRPKTSRDDSNLMRGTV